MQTNTKPFIKEVIREIKAIKRLTNTEEKNNLNFKTFNPNDNIKCIYGQLTGNCWSDRADQILKKIKIKYWFDRIDDKYPIDAHNQPARGSLDITPLECFIFQYPKYNKEIIQYLKGENEFDLKELYNVLN